jgi:RNA chaperone Hfq
MRIEPRFLFDLDGTLVDSVYQHVLAWKRALEAEDIELSVWRIHRKIGMSGGLFTHQLLRETGLEIDAALVERLRERHAAAYREQAASIRPLPGARELLAALSSAGLGWAIATSGRMETAGPVLETLGVDPSRVPVITRDKVKYAKPDPDLFLAAAAREAQPMTLFLVNGVMLQGHVSGFDQFSVLLERDGLLQLVYKHAISTLQPPHALDLGEHGSAPEEPSG